MRLNFEKFAAHKELLAVCTSLDDTVCQNVIVDIQKLILDTYLFWVQVQRAFNFLLPVLRNLKEIHQTFQIFPELFRQLEEWCMKASFVEKQRVSVLTWWKGHSWVLQLSRIAIRSLSVPQTASPCERNWKAFRSIRRKNGIDEQKLVSLLQNLLLLENQAQVVQKKCDWVPLLTATLWWKSMWGKSCRIWFFSAWNETQENTEKQKQNLASWVSWANVLFRPIQSLHLCWQGSDWAQRLLCQQALPTCLPLWPECMAEVKGQRQAALSKSGGRS